jgi:hypothetical protein
MRPLNPKVSTPQGGAPHGGGPLRDRPGARDAAGTGPPGARPPPVPQAHRVDRPGAPPRPRGRAHPWRGEALGPGLSGGALGLQAQPLGCPLGQARAGAPRAHGARPRQLTDRATAPHQAGGLVSGVRRSRTTCSRRPRRRAWRGARRHVSWGHRVDRESPNVLQAARRLGGRALATSGAGRRRASCSWASGQACTAAAPRRSRAAATSREAAATGSARRRAHSAASSSRYPRSRGARSRAAGAQASHQVATPCWATGAAGSR